MFQSSPMNWFIYLILLLFIILKLIVILTFKKSYLNKNYKMFNMKKKYVK